MTNELEKQFFDTFGIEPNCQNTFINPSKCPFNESRRCYDCVSFDYPQITDRILLELTAIHSCWCLPRLCCFNVEQLKEQVLSDLTLFNDKRIELIHQVRTLFEEG